jgi:hypothetical protein
VAGRRPGAEHEAALSVRRGVGENLNPTSRALSRAAGHLGRALAMRTASSSKRPAEAQFGRSGQGVRYPADEDIPFSQPQDARRSSHRAPALAFAAATARPQRGAWPRRTMKVRSWLARKDDPLARTGTPAGAFGQGENRGMRRAEIGWPVQPGNDRPGRGSRHIHTLRRLVRLATSTFSRHCSFQNRSW